MILKFLKSQTMKIYLPFNKNICASASLVEVLFKNKHIIMYEDYKPSKKNPCKKSITNMAEHLITSYFNRRKFYERNLILENFIFVEIDKTSAYIVIINEYELDNSGFIKEGSVKIEWNNLIYNKEKTYICDILKALDRVIK